VASALICVGGIMLGNQVDDQHQRQQPVQIRPVSK
jgi:hypothetical protein